MKMLSRSRAIDKIYKRRDRLDIPDWQRQQVWTHSKKQSLIDSILKGWKLPKFYFLLTNEEPEAFEVVDGQQRLAAIFEFKEGNLELPQASGKLFGGATYDSLPDTIQDRFDDYEIQYDQIDDASDEEVKEFFQRLQAGLLLTSSEKLNSVHSKLRDFCARHAKHEFFKNKTCISDRRYGHFDVLAKCAAIEVDGLDIGLRYDDLHAVFVSQSSFSPKSNVAKRVKATIEFLDGAFQTQNRRLRNRTIVQSLFTLAARVVETGKSTGWQQRFTEFFDSFMDELSKQIHLGHMATDPDYLEFQKTVSANVRSGPKTRQQILMRKLFLFDSRFLDLFDPKVVLGSGLTQGIQTYGSHIADLVDTINRKYSAINGMDLFKMTTITARSIRSLVTPIRDVGQYKCLIDSLYFTFWEGTGNRLEGGKPQSFKDVNSLRTSERHDVDHGKDAKVKTKKKTIGGVCKKYSGVASPDQLGPEQFARMQMKLYVELSKDLQHLLSKI
ncbi:MAG: DUF262 domain-containing protein [candidate division Zixibacteria bacterium]|nr:DUF262 domain-containing protein [candidate division Zixibacteria bacterium]